MTYPVYKKNMSKRSPATPCAGAGLPESAAIDRKHNFMVKLMQRRNNRKILRNGKDKNNTQG